MNAQVKQDNSTKILQQQKTIAGLAEKLNAFQTYEVVIYDDQCVAEWRKLQVSLENWVTKSFKNSTTLTTMTVNSLMRKGMHNLYIVPPKEILEKSVHTRRKYIQSLVTCLILNEVFMPLFVQTPNYEISSALQEMGNKLKDQVDHRIWEHWRSSTSLGLQLLDFGEWAQHICHWIIDTVFLYFGEYYAQEVSLVHDKLEKFFWECALFKRKLERGKFDYQFECSGMGASSLKEYMKSVNAEDEDGAIVQMSVWPAILKSSSDKGQSVLDREAFWTSIPKNYSNSNLTGNDKVGNDASWEEIQSAEGLGAKI